MSYTVETIFDFDRYGQSQVDALLKREGLKRDKNLDYTCGIYDEGGELIATGSCFKNTFRCFAVDKDHQGEGFLSKLVSHLNEVMIGRGITHIFLYTSLKNARLFKDMGFYEICSVDEELIFMENRKRGFQDYCEELKKSKIEREKIAAVVMNANPFTKGHQYLVEQAASENQVVHLFVLSEEMGPIPFSVRKKLVSEGVSHLKNVICHDSGPYMISAATFPSYFLPDEESAIAAHAALDIELFRMIAESLQITCRYVGEEPTSRVTSIYNQIMLKKLKKTEIDCRIIERISVNGRIISASAVRQAIHDDQLETVVDMLPESTLRYFKSPEAARVIGKIKENENLVHY